MKVYVLTSTEYDETVVDGVYGTPARAMSQIPCDGASWTEDGLDNRWYFRKPGGYLLYEVQMHEVI